VGQLSFEGKPQRETTEKRGMKMDVIVYNPQKGRQEMIKAHFTEDAKVTKLGFRKQWKVKPGKEPVLGHFFL
jgi:hypothetical protein